jgi:hypothetical protein
MQLLIGNGPTWQSMTNSGNVILFAIAFSTRQEQGALATALLQAYVGYSWDRFGKI